MKIKLLTLLILVFYISSNSTAYNTNLRGEKKYVLDAPWRIAEDHDVIPVVVYWNTREGLEKIDILDATNNNVISSKSLSSLVDVNSAILPVTVTFSIEKTRLQTVNGKVKIKGKLFTNYYQTFETDTIEIITNTDTVPKLTDYYCGDTHYHSSYTNNPTEYGGPINETKKVAKAIELDWITTTDHSFDLNDTPDKWSSFVDECNQIDEKFKCLVGEEVSCHISGTYRPFNAYSHFLGYNIGEYILGDEFEDGLGLNNILCRNINDHVEYMGGFGYVAHPMHGDGDPFRHTWKDFSLNYTGLQIWNGVPPYHDELLSGLRMWQSLLSEHLSSGRRVFVEGGNDAHGDFNSRFGKVRTCCYMEDFTKDNVFDALKNGRCYMTDGPALSFKVNDALIGEMLTVNTGEAVNLSFTWKSTPEFGFIEKIFIYKGAAGVDEEVVWKVNASLETPDAPKTMMYSGEVEEWLQMFEPAYFRMEARTSSGHIAYTNPIWVNVSASGNLELEKIKVTYEESASSSGEGGSVDGNFNHGEHTTFDVYVKNTGPVDAVNAKASISASGDCLLIHDTRVKSLGAVSPGSTAIAYDFYLRLDEDSGNCNALKDGKINLNVTLRHGNNGVIEKTIPVTLYVNPNDGPEFEETTSSGSQESDELYVIEADMIGEDVFGSQELYAFYRCGSTDISRNAYDGFVKMRRTCQDACGSQHEFQGKLAGIAEKCEGKRLYYRIKFEGDGRGWWSPIEAYDGGLILDDDSAPPQINVASSSGPIKPGEFYEFAADLTDAKGVLDSEYYPLAYYSWGENLVDAGNFDGVVKLSGDGTLYTGLLNVSEVYEGDTLYYRIYAGDGDNTPKYGWSQTQTGPTVHMKPPTTPAMVDATFEAYNYTVDWTDSLDGSGVVEYELREEHSDGSVSITNLQATEKEFYDSQLQYVPSPPRYSVRAKDTKGNFGEWSQEIPVQFPDITVASEDIEFNETPSLGEKVLVTASVRNIGEGNPHGYPVDFYDGPPCGGVKLDTVNASITQGGGYTIVSFVWTPTAAGNHNIHVYADHGVCCGTCIHEMGLKEKKYWEKNEDNNWASKSVTITENSPCIGSIPPEAGIWFIGLDTICRNAGVSLSGSMLSFTGDAVLSLENASLVFV